MLREIRLQNFMSFGPLTKVPLEPITVIVGPNNSGKSCFLSLQQLVHNVLVGGWHSAVNAAGGLENLVHRPASAGDELKIEWDGTDGTSYAAHLRVTKDGVEELAERLLAPGAEVRGGVAGNTFQLVRVVKDSLPNGELIDRQPGLGSPLVGLRRFYRDPAFFSSWGGFLDGRLIRLVEERMRRDAQIVSDPALTATGEGMPAVLDAWRAAKDERAAAFDKFVRDCLPEIDDVLLRGAPQPGSKRIWVRQKDGQEFDTAHVSDGVLFFLALAMHAVAAAQGSMLLIEEPERSVHPRRIHEIVDVLRAVVRQRGCQIIMTTHSRVVVDRFRDEPEAIVLFRRGENGTEVRRLVDLPKLMEALDRADPYKRADPGDMLENGLFNEPFPDPA